MDQNRGGKLSRFNRWYRKRARDGQFRKQQNSDDSNSDSDSSQPPQMRQRANDVDVGPLSPQPPEPMPIQEVGDESDESNGDEEDENDDQLIAGDVGESSGDKDENDQDLQHPEPVFPPNLQVGGNDGNEEEASEGDGSDSNRGSENEESEWGSDSSADEDVSADEDFEDDDTPLYDGARITLGESLMAILSFALSYKVTGQCLSDLLALIVLHCGPNNLCVKTLYRFKKYFKLIGRDMINKHFFCSVCEIPLQSKNSICETCNGQHDVAYFLEFPIKEQLQSMYKRDGFYESLLFRLNREKKNEANIEDIYDGEIYKSQVENGLLTNPNNITFFMYFDGIALYKSSSFSIWPVYLSINELKYTERVKKENTILAGIWFGKSKPNPNLFLRPLQECLASLQMDGVNLSLPGGQVLTVKARVIGAVADMPAKSLFMRFTQFNGAFSCFNCMAQGGRFDLGNASVQIFPYSRDIQLRTNDETRDFAEQALIARQNNAEASVYGVKGPSLLSLILPNLILSMATDIMHGIFLGVMRTLLSLWFEGQYSMFPFSISNFVHIVDIRLKGIRPPSFMRVPRSLKKEFALMKASDFKLFFFYFSLPVLNGILPQRFWEHHLKIVTAISLLSQDSVSLEQVNVAEELLHEYVSGFQELYGLRHMSLTFHQLLHLPMLEIWEIRGSILAFFMKA